MPTLARDGLNAEAGKGMVQFTVIEHPIFAIYPLRQKVHTTPTELTLVLVIFAYILNIWLESS